MNIVYLSDNPRPHLKRTDSSLPEHIRGKLDCKYCGIRKTPKYEKKNVFGNTCLAYYKQGDYYGFRQGCSLCESEKWKRVTLDSDGYYNFNIYSFIDENNVIRYIGATGNYTNRMSVHTSKCTIQPGEYSKVIENERFLNKEEGMSWAKRRENYHIDANMATIRNKLRSGYSC